MGSPGARATSRSANQVAGLDFKSSDCLLLCGHRRLVRQRCDCPRLRRRTTKISKIAADPSFGPFDAPDVVRFYPSTVSERLVTQRGFFTVHPDHSSPLK